MAWEKTITNKGLALQAKILAGANVNITRAGVGGNFVSPDQLASSTGVANYLNNVVVDVNPPIVQGGKAVIRTVVTNDGMTTPTTYYQVGVFADDPDDGEILYLIAQDPAGYLIPSIADTPEFRAQYDFEILVSLTSDIHVNYDPSNRVTHEQLEAELERIREDISYKAPTNHKSPDDTYGVGNETNYGHLKADMDGATSISVQRKYLTGTTIDFNDFTVFPDARAGIYEFMGVTKFINGPPDTIIQDYGSGYITVHKDRLGTSTLGVELHIHGYPVIWLWSSTSSWVKVEGGRYKTFGVQIDLTNSNPETSVTYTDDAVGMAGGSAVWESQAIFRNIKPCVINDGRVRYYLNPSNFAQKEDGSDANITGADGDVMIEIPKTGFQISTSGNIVSVKITDDPAKKDFKYYAHSRQAEGDRQKLYIGAYKGQIVGGKLRSISGVTPTTEQTIGAFRVAAQANGSGYDLVSFHPLTLIQCLYLIRFKNLDSQTALGQGNTDWRSTLQNAGGTNASGMFYGTSSTSEQVKCFGIEDLWGNIWEWIDGLYCDSNRNIMTAFTGFNDNGAGYFNRGSGGPNIVVGWMSAPQGTTEMGFIIKEKNGSETTYFADSASLTDDNNYQLVGGLPFFGGGWENGEDGGVFSLNIRWKAYDKSYLHGGRLMYL